MTLILRTNDLKKQKFQKLMCENNFILEKMLKTLKRKNQRSFFLEMSVKQKLINITISIKITSIIVMTKFTIRDIMNEKNVLSTQNFRVSIKIVSNENNDEYI